MLLHITALENGLHREFSPLAEIPDFVQQAFIESEDKHFYAHFGIDFVSIFRAVFQNLSEGRTVSGASTISMQLARIIRPNPHRTLLAKICEAFDALRLEARLSKKEILELYLNNVPFGFNTEGVTSAARYFFSKELFLLSSDEAKLLSMIPRRPSLYNPANYTENYTPFSYPFEAPHFVRYISNLPDSKIGKCAEIHTTLSLTLQQKAQSLLSNSVKEYEKNRLSNGAVLICDTQSGAILAWVGSADFFDDEHSGQVDGVLSTQQPGSSMKPFLYALALENGFYPSSVLADIPMEFGFENLYVPQNFNNRFNGPVRLRVALASSLNIPAVFLLNELGLDSYCKKLSDLHFDSLKNANPGLSLALGGAETSIFEMTQAFSVFARDGIFIPLCAFEDELGASESEQVYDVNTARLICDMLSDKEARSLGFGYNQAFSTPFPSIFKTGTANQYQTITAIASTPDYTLGIWMGNFSGETVIGKTGSSIPAKIAKDLLVFMQGNTGNDFKKPSQFKKEKICSLSGMKAGKYCPNTISEYVMHGSDFETAPECSWHTPTGTAYPAEYATWFRLKNRSGEVHESDSSLKIVSPRNGSVFYYDESISVERQKLFVEVTGGTEDSARFYVDDTFLEEKVRPFVASIKIEKGRHEILVECGEEIARIQIDVR